MTPPLFSTEPPAGHFQDLRVEPEEARSILRPQRDERYGFGFALSPYRGCGHGCRYCYVREYPQGAPGEGLRGTHAAADWGTWSSPKLNAPELLWAQRHRLHGQRIFMASATDPYQPLERAFRLTRACLEVLLQCPTTRVLLHTRSPLVLQDLELLKAFGPRLTVGLSIPTDDDTVRQVVEPRAPAIPSRWVAVERLCQAGLEVVVAATPLLPMENPRVFARRAKDSGVAGAWAGGLRLLKDDPFQGVLAEHGWLRALDPAYVAEVRGALAEFFPGGGSCGRRSRPAPRERVPARLAPPPSGWAQPRGLFEGL